MNILVLINSIGNLLLSYTKQGDDRTVRSDLKTLEGAGLIRKVRSGAHGVGNL